MPTLAEIEGTKWTGNSELWLDPLGDQAIRSDCTIAIDGGVVRYTWSHEDKGHEGSITLRDYGADFADSWHQPEPLKCLRVLDGQGLFQVEGRYGPEQDWRWRIGLSLRASSGELVLQMTNVTSWGEEVRAVRMICKRR
jgi:hypothetical protein